MSVPLDQPVRLAFSTYSDTAGTIPADPTAITLDVLDPTGATTTHTWPAGDITKDSTGAFHYTITPAAAGHYAYHWKATGTVATALDGSFDVDRKYGVWVALTDVKAELNIPAADTSQDAELAGFTAAAVDVVENIVGPISDTTYTEPYDGGQPVIVLRRYPVLAVTSITEYSGGSGQVLASEPLGTSPYTGYGYQANLDAGVITRTNGGVPYRFAAGTANVVVVYRAGRAAVPPSVRLAALELIRHMWETQRGGGNVGLPSLDPDFAGVGTPGAGFLVPNRVNELLAPYRKAPKVA